MAYEKQTWADYDDKLTKQQNIARGAVGTAARMDHIEQGVSAAHTELEDIGANYRPNLDKSALATITSYPFEADLVDNGARMQFINFTISCMCSAGKFVLDVPAGTLDFAHGQKICVDTSTRATDIIFIQPEWPTEATVWAIGSMTTNAVIVNGTATQRKIVTIYGAGSITRDYT